MPAGRFDLSQSLLRGEFVTVTFSFTVHLLSLLRLFFFSLWQENVESVIASRHLWTAAFPLNLKIWEFCNNGVYEHSLKMSLPWET